MKKSRPTKRPDSDGLRSLPPLRKKITPPPSPPLVTNGTVSAAAAAAPHKRSPNYMKSTSSFEARKERSPPTVTSRVSLKASSKSKAHSSGAGQKASRTSSLKLVRTLTKTPSFKPSRPSKKCSSVILCEDLDAQRATCSSTLKDSKFPNYLQLSPGGTELEGTSATKVCPYSYCSLNGHRHTPLPPLRCFLSARKRALKTQKSFKLGCLSPRQTKPKPIIKKNEETDNGQVIFAEEAPVEVDVKGTPSTPLIEERGRDFFIEIYSKDGEGKGSQDSECSEIDWEEGCSYASSPVDGQTFNSQEMDGDVREEQILKTGAESLGHGLQGSYDEESVSSEAWLEEDGASESDSSLYQETKINHQDQSVSNSDAVEVSPTTTMADGKDEMGSTCGSRDVGLEAADELQGMKQCNIDYQQEETPQESETVPDLAGNSPDGDDKHQTIIYNIIQINVSVFVNGERTEHSEKDKGVTAQVPAAAADKMETDDQVNDASLVVGIEASQLAKKQGMTNEGDDDTYLTAFDEASEVNQMVADEEPPLDAQDIVSKEQLDVSYLAEKQDLPEEEHMEYETDSRSNSMRAVEEIHEEHASRSDEQTHSTDEISINLRGSTRGKKPDQEMEDSREFNPRGPNFLPQVPDPDAETVDLRHQIIDERKNAEEWMVDFALQQAVTTLAPARKRKVALLVEAFEKVMPIPKYEARNRHTPKAFTNARPMQACS